MQESLPTLDKIRALEPEEKHSTPVAVIQAGSDIGELAEAIEKNPTLAAGGLDFYDKCARRSELSTPVRALCLSDLRELGKKHGLPPDESGIPENVVKMADVMKMEPK